MRWTFDVDAGALYAQLSEGRSARQAEIADGVVVDLDAHDTVLGVEFLSPYLPYEQLAALGVSATALDILGYVVNTPLPRRAAGTLIPAGHVRGDQAVERTLDVRAEPIPA
jgi:uncharacterized protein YuzE